jgi:hypothetical protein
MSTITLATGQITAADKLTIELVQAIETPDTVLIRWPAAPTVTNPRRFPAAALAVIAIMDEAMIALSKAGEM